MMSFIVSRKNSRMRYIIFLSLLLFSLTGCKKEHGSRVDIYLLKSFTAGVDQSATPAVNTIANAVLEDAPLVSDDNILFYVQDSHTFLLRKDIKGIIQNYGPDKAFAVTVDGEVVYYGSFHPAYLSSMKVGLATIDPILVNNRELRIDFVNLTGTFVHQLDKRNDKRIVDALKATGRLK